MTKSSQDSILNIKLSNYVSRQFIEDLKAFIAFHL